MKQVLFKVLIITTTLPTFTYCYSYLLLLSQNLSGGSKNSPVHSERWETLSWMALRSLFVFNSPCFGNIQVFPVL